MALKDAGVSRLNISLDSLKRERYKAITGRDQLDSVLSGLDAALMAGFTPVKINMVVMKGVNDDEVDDMVQFCSARGFVLPLIEVMPMGDTGRNSQYIDLQPIKRQLQEKYALKPDKHEFQESPSKIVRFMNMTGG